MIGILLSLLVSVIAAAVALWAFGQERVAHRAAVLEANMLRGRLKRIGDVEAEAARIWGEAALEATLARDEANLERQTRDRLASEVAALRSRLDTVTGTRLFDHDGETWTVSATLPPPGLLGFGDQDECSLGWVIFESHDSARLLSPVPGDWEYCHEDDLAEYLEGAVAVQPSRVR